jgi:hypothetical protein
MRYIIAVSRSLRMLTASGSRLCKSSHGVSVACRCRVTDRQQTRRDARVAMALDGRRTIRRETRRYRAAAPRPAGRRCSRCCSVRTRHGSCGRSAAWPRAPARRPARGWSVKHRAVRFSKPRDPLLTSFSKPSPLRGSGFQNLFPPRLTARLNPSRRIPPIVARYDDFFSSSS